MGAGRKAARSMKKYLGIRDHVTTESLASADRIFGIDPREHNFVRVRVA